jgi:hypothetical protein
MIGLPPPLACTLIQDFSIKKKNNNFAIMIEAAPFLTLVKFNRSVYFGI